MELFNPVVGEDKLHANFKAVMVRYRSAERSLLAKWVEGFEDRDGKLVKEFQTTFNSTFWEIYLYACFREYGFKQDWSKAAPDFCLTAGDIEFVVEATTGNAAQGKPNEWDKTYSTVEMASLRRFNSLNKEAMVRLSNAIVSKARKYDEQYQKLKHVDGKPFVLAVAPFEQPHFNLQYDRPIRALLYDYYVDEDAALDHPELYPLGPPTVQLGYVEKENGAEIPLGIFNDAAMEMISAVVFSCTATWGKLSSMSTNPDTVTEVFTTWSTVPDGVPMRRAGSPAEIGETLLDGLQVYHNPNAKYPLSPEIFRRKGVVQHFIDPNSEEWVYEGRTDALLFRHVNAQCKR